MNFKLGDFVRFVDERREGYITRIIDEQMVGVTGDDDFEIPMPASKITRVHGHNYEDNQGTVSFQDTKADTGEFLWAKATKSEFLETKSVSQEIVMIKPVLLSSVVLAITTPSLASRSLRLAATF